MRAWDASGAPIGRYPTGNVIALAFSGHRRRARVVACLDFGPDVHIWDPISHTVSHPFYDSRSYDDRSYYYDARSYDDRSDDSNPFLSGYFYDPHFYSRYRYAFSYRAQSAVIGHLDNRELIVYGCDDGVVRIWDEVGNGWETLTGHDGPVQAVAVGQLASRDVIVSGGEDGRINIWDAAGSGSPIGQTVTGHDGPVQAVAIGQLKGQDVIVSTGTDRTLRIWNTLGDPFGYSLALVEPGIAVAIGPSGIVVACGSALASLGASPPVRPPPR
jgi:WD40 repeat protein